MPFGHALSSRLKPLDNREPLHPRLALLSRMPFGHALASSLRLSQITGRGRLAETALILAYFDE